MSPLHVTAVTGAWWALALALYSCERPAPPRDLPPEGVLLAHVTDATGAPVEAALFEGLGAFTDGDGVATGALSVGPGGFTRLEAPGYATTWTRPLPGLFEEKQLLLARLTPLEWVAPVRPDGTRTLSLGARAAADLVLEAGPMTFPLPAVLSLARVRAQDLGPLAFAPREPGLGRHLQRALWLEGAIEGVAARIYAPLRVAWRHAAQAVRPTLGRFEPESGTWRLALEACTHDEASVARCRLPSLGLWALFADEGPPVTGDEWLDAQHALFGGLAEGSVGDCAAAPLFASAARRFAQAQPGVAGLHALLAGAAVARAAGEAALERDLLERAEPLLERRLMAEDGADCGRVVELVHLRELARTVGVSRSWRRTLDERIEHNQWSCEVWAGWVHSALLLGDALEDEDAAALVDGASSWRERHAVRLSIDVFGAARGTATVRLALPAALYRDDADGPSSCGDDFREVSLRGDPEDANVTLSLSGRVGGDVWTVTAVPADTSPAPALLTRARSQRWVEGGDACLLVEDSDVLAERLPAFTSLLCGGLDGQPVVSLSDVLTHADRADNPLGAGAKDRHGFTRVALRRPGWPFTDALVSWRFFQLTPLRPVE